MRVAVVVGFVSPDRQMYNTKTSTSSSRYTEERDLEGVVAVGVKSRRRDGLFLLRARIRSPTDRVTLSGATTAGMFLAYLNSLFWTTTTIELLQAVCSTAQSNSSICQLAGWSGQSGYLTSREDVAGTTGAPADRFPAFRWHFAIDAHHDPAPRSSSFSLRTSNFRDTWA